MKQKGFTLIELLVVIAIIALLASVVLVSLDNAKARSRDASRLSDIRGVIGALELYFNKNSGYPAQASSGPVPNALVTDFDINHIPVAPIPPDGSCTETQNVYAYQSTVPTAYTLTFCIGKDTGSYVAGPHTATEHGIQ
jgi:prepilin-type N-terminal cleavage/methylation domain-containing protein